MEQERPSVEDLALVMRELLEVDREANEYYRFQLEGYTPEITFKPRYKEIMAKHLRRQGVKGLNRSTDESVLVEAMRRMLERDAFFAGLLTKYEEGQQWTVEEYDRAYALLNALQYSPSVEKVVTDEDLYMMMSGILSDDRGEEREINEFYTRVLLSHKEGKLWSDRVRQKVLDHLKYQNVEMGAFSPQTPQWELAVKVENMLQRDKLFDELVALYENGEKWPAGKRETALILLGMPPVVTGKASTITTKEERETEERRDDRELFRLIDIILNDKHTPDRLLYETALDSYELAHRFSKEEKHALVDSFSRLRWGSMSLITPDSEVAERVRKIVTRGGSEMELLLTMYELYRRKKKWTGEMRVAAWDYLHIPPGIVEDLPLEPEPPVPSSRTKLVIRVPPPPSMEQRGISPSFFTSIDR
jgi:hypothetical protein